MSPIPRAITPAGLSDVADALRRFVDLIAHRAGKALSKMEEAGVTLPQVLVLAHVERAGSPSISTLAEGSPGTAAAMSQMVDRLVRQGWLARSESPDDRRRKAVSLTPRGARLLREIAHARTLDYAAGLSRLPPTLHAELNEWLQRAIPELGKSVAT